MTTKRGHLVDIFHPSSTPEQISTAYTLLGKMLTTPTEIVELLDLSKEVISNLGNHKLRGLCMFHPEVNLYEAAISYNQSARSKTGKFFERLWASFLAAQAFTVVEQPKSLSTKRADICLDNRIVIDTTTTNRERLRNKVLYLEHYPDYELHIISGDPTAPSSADVETFIEKHVHLVVRDDVYETIDNDSPYLHKFSSYVNEIRE
tara:strand:- start:161 stop:775 length:615 start_codon:yes stop_codon:yes gene_type:complete